jgi:hypothetical protein
MTQRSTNRRSAGVAGVKALMATASVAATIFGWALLPANDPQAAAGAGGQASQQQPPALSVPDSGNVLPPNNNLTPNNNQFVPSSPNSQLPQVQAPPSSSRFPFTRTHSSR